MTLPSGYIIVFTACLSALSSISLAQQTGIHIKFSTNNTWSCLTSNEESGSKVGLSPCNQYFKEQRWNLMDNGLISSTSGLCLAASYSENASAKKMNSQWEIRQKQCNVSDRLQLFYFDPTSQHLMFSDGSHCVISVNNQLTAIKSEQCYNTNYLWKGYPIASAVAFTHPRVTVAGTFSALKQVKPPGVLEPAAKVQRSYTPVGKVINSMGLVNAWRKLDNKIAAGHPNLLILQTNQPQFEKEADSLIFGCKQTDRKSYLYYSGCQIMSDRSIATPAIFASGNIHHDPDDENIVEFSNRLFNGNKPDIWSVTAQDDTMTEISNVKAGNYLLSSLGILAITRPQIKTDNYDLVTQLTEYYNSLTVSHPKQSYSNIKRKKRPPDMVSYSYNGNKDDAATVATIAAEASSLLSLTYLHPSLTDARHPLIIKAIMMTGATKSPETFNQLDIGYRWKNNPPLQPLDNNFGAGLYNRDHALSILQSGEQKSEPDVSSASGWSLLSIRPDNQVSYLITTESAAEEFSLVLTWFYQHKPVSKSDYVTYLPDLSVEVSEENSGTVISRSDSPNNNLEHLYLTTLKPDTRYRITISRTDSHTLPIVAALAWQSRNPFKAESVVRPQLFD